MAGVQRFYVLRLPQDSTRSVASTGKCTLSILLIPAGAHAVHRSSQSNQLIVPPVKLSNYGPRSFAVAGPTVWNNLTEYLRDPELSLDNFRRQLKTFLFAQY